MPEVECPITGCDYKTPDLEASIVTVLIDAHCKNHGDNPHTTTAQTRNSTISDQNGIHVRSSESTFRISNQSSTNKRNFIGLFLCSFAFILDLAISFSLQYWFERKDTLFSTNTTTTVGLWRGCVVVVNDEGEKEQCWDHNDKEFPFNFMFVGAAQVFQCFGVIFMALAILSTAIKLFRYQRKEELIYFAGFLAIVAAICFVGSAFVVSFGLKRISTPTKDYTRDTHISYYFASISGILSFSGGATLLSHKIESCLYTCRLNDSNSNNETIREEDGNI